MKLSSASWYAWVQVWGIALVAAGCSSERAVLLVGSSSAGTTSTTGLGSSGAGGSGASAECPASELPIDAARPGYSAPQDPSVAALLQTMSPDAKVKQLYGIADPPEHSGDAYSDINRCDDVDIGNGKSIRGFRYRDGVRGVNLAAGQLGRPSLGHDFSVSFPTPSIRAASWDIELEMTVGEAIGDETMASKNNMLFAPCVNILRHPYWGRSQDSYGEDMYHIGRMASAFTAGVQQHVIACAKHFAANNIERNRVDQNADIDEQTLREIYGRHFEMVVREGGAGCVMAAFNSINGKKSTQNKHLLTDILKDPIDRGGFGFRGLVISDLWAMPGYQDKPAADVLKPTASEAFQAGLDIELPWGMYYAALGALVGDGTISQAALDDAVGHVLEQKLRFQSVYTDSPWGLGTTKTRLDGDSITNDQDHLDLAELVELKSAVLLSNGLAGKPVLPITNVQSIAVVGLEVSYTLSDIADPLKSGSPLGFATDVNLGDRGSSRVNADPANSVGPFAGIQTAAAPHGISVTTGTEATAALGANFVVAVVGLTPGDEGEEYTLDSHGDRTTLSISADQEKFVNEVLSLDKPTAIIIESGSIVNLPWLAHPNQQQATIWAGYGGMRAGLALGKLLFGEVNFSGKMPLAWPKETDLQPFTTDGLTTKMGYFFGYRDYDDRARKGNPVSLIFPFGWGMSYTQFAYSNLTPPCGSTRKDNVVTYVADVTNSGSVDGEETVMLFVAGPANPPGITGYRSVKELKSFAKVKIAAGQTARVNLPLNIQDLRHWEGNASGSWVIDDGEYTILVGPNAADPALQLSAKLTIHD